MAICQLMDFHKKMILLPLVTTEYEVRIWNCHKKRYPLIYRMSLSIKVEDFGFVILVICNSVGKIWRLHATFCYSDAYHKVLNVNSNLFQVEFITFPFKTTCRIFYQWHQHNCSNHLTFHGKFAREVNLPPLVMIIDLWGRSDVTNCQEFTFR